MVYLLSTSEFQGNLKVKTYNSGFPEAHDTYNALSATSDGRIYYVLSSNLVEVSGKMYVFNRATDETKLLAYFTEICGEKDSNFIRSAKPIPGSTSAMGNCIFPSNVGYYELIVTNV